MLFYQEFYVLWASLELFMALTHLFVFLGFRNSKLNFLRRQQNYFLLDGLMHLTNTFLFPLKTSGVLLCSMWIYAVFAHLYYYRNLIINPVPRYNKDGAMEEDNSDKISRIFHWSCIEFKANRFNIFQSGKEMLETTLDVVTHTAAFILAFQNIQSTWYRIGALTLMFGLFYSNMLTLKYFLTEPKMMPELLRRFFTNCHSMAVVKN